MASQASVGQQPRADPRALPVGGDGDVGDVGVADARTSARRSRRPRRRRGRRRSAVAVTGQLQLALEHAVATTASGTSACSIGSTSSRCRRRIGSIVSVLVGVAPAEAATACSCVHPSLPTARVDQLIRASGARRYSGWISHGLTHSSRSARAWASCTSGAADGWARNCSAKSQLTAAAIWSR